MADTNEPAPEPAPEPVVEPPTPKPKRQVVKLSDKQKLDLK